MIIAAVRAAQGNMVQQQQQQGAPLAAAAAAAPPQAAAAPEQKKQQKRKREVEDPNAPKKLTGCSYHCKMMGLELNAEAKADPPPEWLVAARAARAAAGEPPLGDAQLAFKECSKRWALRSEEEKEAWKLKAAEKHARDEKAYARQKRAEAGEVVSEDEEEEERRRRRRRRWRRRAGGVAGAMPEPEPTPSVFDGEAEEDEGEGEAEEVEGDEGEEDEEKEARRTTARRVGLHRGGRGREEE